MPLSLSDLLLGCVVPATASLMLWLLGQFLLLRRTHSSGEVQPANYALLTIFSLLAGLLLGYGLLGVAPWIPKFHWHYWPYTLLTSCVIAAAAQFCSDKHALKVLLVVSTAIPVAWFLVPTWPDLQPSRMVYLVATVVFLTLVTFSYDRNFTRAKESNRGEINYLHLGLTASQISLVVLIFLSGSLRFTQLAMLAASCVIALQLIPKARCFFDTTAFPICAMQVGLLLVAEVHSFSAIPKLVYLLIPLSPVVTMIGSLGRNLSNSDGHRAGWLGPAAWINLWLPASLCLSAILWAVAVTDFSTGGESY